MEKEIRAIANRLVKLKHAVFLTGAGISTPSGIPDFRSEGGLWSRYDSNVYANYLVFLEDPSFYWEMAMETTPLILDAEPNLIHESIAELEALGIVDAVITQNIDFLHQRAGSREIVELHGTYKTLTCMDCHQQIERRDIIKKIMDPAIHIPRCQCGGTYQPDVVLFHQVLDPAILHRAEKLASECNTLIVVGSSLTVAPANVFPIIASNAGAKFFIFNASRTFLDQEADAVIPGDAVEIMDSLMHMVRTNVD